jgi:putative transposase
VEELGVSERRACRVLGQHRSTHRKIPFGREDEAALTAGIVALATRYGRYGSRRITALLRSAGWVVNPKRVERIWRREGLKVPARQPKRGLLWFADGSCIRLRPEQPNDVWSYDFVEGRTHGGGKLRMLNVIDEFTRECLAIRVRPRLRSMDVINVLSDHFILRDELLDREIFYSLDETRVVIEGWRRHYNAVRPHSSLGYRPPAPEAVVPSARPPAQPRPAPAGALSMGTRPTMN